MKTVEEIKELLKKEIEQIDSFDYDEVTDEFVGIRNFCEHLLKFIEDKESEPEA